MMIQEGRTLICMREDVLGYDEQREEEGCESSWGAGMATCFGVW